MTLSPDPNRMRGWLWDQLQGLGLSPLSSHAARPARAHEGLSSHAARPSPAAEMERIRAGQDYDTAQIYRNALDLGPPPAWAPPPRVAIGLPGNTADPADSVSLLERMLAAGVEPAPYKKIPWMSFVQAHLDQARLDREFTRSHARKPVNKYILKMSDR